MRALPTQARAKLKRTALVDAAVLSFSTLGFEVSTAKSIAAQAGVATGTFYQYFDNKNEILRVIATERYGQLQAHLEWFDVTDRDLMEGDLNQVFLRFFQSIYDFHEKNSELHQVLEQRKTQDEQLMVIMNEGQEDLFSRLLLFVKSFDIEQPEVVTSNLFAMGEGVVHRQVFEKTNLNTNDVLIMGAKMLASYFINQR